jgi:hypothetical protein
MKSVDILIWSLVFFSILLTGVGGVLNMLGTESVSMRFSSQHSWNDGLMLMLLAILIAILYK